MWIDKLVGVALKGIPATVGMIPDHVRRKAMARVRDHNPFRYLPVRAELVRALRIAWVEATFPILEVARDLAGHPDWISNEAPIRQFEKLARQDLVKLRDAAITRREDLKELLIDEGLGRVIDGVAERGNGAEGSEAELADGFVDMLANVTGWPTTEVPAIFGHLARHGLSVTGSSSPRNFDELVFAEFAELLTDSKRYPQAGPAFRTAMQAMSLDIERAIWGVVQGIDPRLDAIQSEVGKLRTLGDALSDYLAQGQRIEATLASMSDEVATRVVALLNAGGGIVRLAEDAGTTQSIVIALAQQLKPDRNFDYPQALLELQKAIEVARDVMAQAQEDPQLGDGLLVVLAQVAEHTQQGQFDVALAALEEALVADRRLADAEFETRKARQRVLLGACLNQHLLRFDAGAAAGAIEAIVAIDHPERPVWTQRFRDFRDEYHREGDQRGILISIEIAIELSRRMVASAASEHEQGIALVALQESLAVQGARDRQPTRLHEAVLAGRDAIALLERSGTALEVAHAENELGNALHSLGMRERKPGLLKEAVDAHRAARRKISRVQNAARWAAIQNCLGNALCGLGELKEDRALLELSIATYRGALRERKQAIVPDEWAKTQSNLGKAYCSLAQQGGGVGAFRQSVRALRKAASIRNPAQDPLGWAGTQINLANALDLLGRGENSAERLREAVRTYDAALSKLPPPSVSPWREMVVASRERTWQHLKVVEQASRREPSEERASR